MIRATDPLKLAQAQASLREKAVDTTPEVRNLQSATSLGSIDILEFRGRIFIIHPLPWRLGAAMTKLSLECKRINNLPDPEERLSEEMRICDEAGVLFNKAVRPIGWRRFVPKRLLRNPFAEASVYEVQQLLLFFSLCRMRSSVRLGSSDPETQEVVSQFN